MQLYQHYQVITTDQSYKIEIISGNILLENVEYLSFIKLFDKNVRRFVKIFTILEVIIINFIQNNRYGSVYSC